MAAKNSREKVKKKSRGMRKHVRRLKQEARKEGTVYRPQKVRRAPEKRAEE